MDDSRQRRGPAHRAPRFGRRRHRRLAYTLLSGLLATMLAMTIPARMPAPVPAPAATPLPPREAVAVIPSYAIPDDNEWHHVPPHLPDNAAPPLAPRTASSLAPDDAERHHVPPHLPDNTGQQPQASPEAATTPAPAAPPIPDASASSYTVRSGDTLSGIATRFGVTVDGLVRINHLPARNYIWPGQVLAVAVGATPAPTLPPTVVPDQQADLLPQAYEVVVEFGHYPWGEPHYGLDLEAPSGTAVTAPVGGVVVEVATGCVVGEVTCGNGWGNHVWWRSALTGHYLLVAHFTTVSAGLAPGVPITAGMLLGYSGTTGYSTGPHVHIQASTTGPNDASAFNPSLELPWESCGHPLAHLGDAWGSSVGC